MLISGVTKLKATLTHFIWGIPTQSLDAVRSFLKTLPEQSPDRPDSIPISRPYRATEDEMEIVPLIDLRYEVVNGLPHTKTQFLRIPPKAAFFALEVLLNRPNSIG